MVEILILDVWKWKTCEDHKAPPLLLARFPFFHWTLSFLTWYMSPSPTLPLTDNTDDKNPVCIWHACGREWYVASGDSRGCIVNQYFHHIRNEIWSWVLHFISIKRKSIFYTLAWYFWLRLKVRVRCVLWSSVQLAGVMAATGQVSPPPAPVTHTYHRPAPPRPRLA